MYVYRIPMNKQFDCILCCLLVLCIAECVKCRIYCGLAAAIYMILMISHFANSVYLYSVMHTFQTIMAVPLPDLFNVKLLPHPPMAGTLSYWIEVQKCKRSKA